VVRLIPEPLEESEPPPPPDPQGIPPSVELVRYPRQGMETPGAALVESVKRVEPKCKPMTFCAELEPLRSPPAVKLPLPATPVQLPPGVGHV
jgi:hypothetical protein